MSHSLDLGPFTLDEPVGAGGMGAVWRARHRDTGQPVAMKFLTADRARTDKYRRQFRREVRSLARLHHPAIATILEYGTVDEATAEAGPEDFRADAPWFAMEFVDGPPLGRVVAEWEWATLRRALIQIFDALAHAHSREIIHRDLKLSNILVDRSAETPTVKLVDFGIAAISEEETAGEGGSSDREAIRGTPRYMAPEQILIQRRDQGPWTDLYALGCLVWRVVCRDAPFDGGSMTEVLQAHLDASRRPFEPRVPVPPGLESWLDRLMRRDPTRRFPTAADAAWHLLQLGEPADTANSPPETLPPDRTTELGGAPTLGALADTIVDPSAGDHRPEEADEARRNDERSDPVESRPPIPPDWRRLAATQADPMPRAGLQLFSLREIPLVDRETIRDTLWGALRRVDAERQTRLVLMEGPAGCGKSRIAEWFVRRAREVGAARPLRAIHTSQRGRHHGVRGMFRRAFHARGLDRGEFYERLCATRPPLRPTDRLEQDQQLEALTELVYPTSGDPDAIDGPPFRFSDPGHRYEIIGRILSSISRRLPLIVWLDDLQWANDTLRLMEHLLVEEADRPILMVGTRRDDIAPGDARQTERLAPIRSHDRSRSLPVGALSDTDQHTLIASMLDLQPGLVDHIAERTEGNPLFARQLLGHWVETGALESAPEGFDLPDRQRSSLPTDIDELWLARIDRLLEAFPTMQSAEVLRALELAATLGREVDRREWQAALEQADLSGPPDLIDQMVERGLASASAEEWSFAHGLLREALVRRARNADRWESHNRRCARALASFEHRREQTAARRATHWREAGEPERALEPLLEESRRLRRICAHRERLEAIEERRAVIEDLGLPAEDRRQLENQIERADCRRMMVMGLDEVVDQLEPVREAARGEGFDVLVAKAWRISASCHRALGNFEEAKDCAEHATSIARRTDDRKTLVRALVTHGWLEFSRGDPQRAHELYEEGHREARQMNDRFLELAARRGLAQVNLTAGNRERAAQLTRETYQRAREHGYRGLEMQSLNDLGDLAKYAGRPDRAADYFRRYEELTRELRQPQAEAVARVNRAAAAVLAHRYREARQHITAAQEICRALSLGHLSSFIDFIELALAASEEDWERYDRQFDRLEEAHRNQMPTMRDFPWIMELAADRAADAGRPRRADRLRSIALEVWKQLGCDDDVERLQAALSSDEHR